MNKIDIYDDFGLTYSQVTKNQAIEAYKCGMTIYVIPKEVYPQIRQSFYFSKNLHNKGTKAEFEQKQKDQTQDKPVNYFLCVEQAYRNKNFRLADEMNSNSGTSKVY